MKHGPLPPNGVRRHSSNTFEVLEDSNTGSQSVRKRKKRHSKPSQQDELPTDRSVRSSAYHSASGSPTGTCASTPFTPPNRHLDRSFTDVSQASKAKSTSPADSPQHSPPRLKAPLASSSSTDTLQRAAPPEEERSRPGTGQSELDAAGNVPEHFWQYVHAELNPVSSLPTADAVWGQTERQRVYNAILYVPYQLERLMGFGLLICCDSFLAIFTMLPLRLLGRVLQLCRPGQPAKAGVQGQQLFDAICIAIFAMTFSFLRVVNAGALYFWMKDLTQEFLKLHVIATAVEILDKIACSFVVDSLEALSGTCTTFASSQQKRQHALAVCMDAAVCLVLVLGHALVLMCQGMAFSVAMNSKRAPALIALVIASNFGEVKGTVFKRFDATKLFALTCADVVERFHLVLALAFVMAEEMVNAGRMWPNGRLLWQCSHILSAEIAIDVLKHAVLGRFNEIRPGVYREFMRDVSERVQGSQSHNIHKVVSFEPLAPAALFLRILVTFAAGQQAAKGPLQHIIWWHWAVAGCIAWLVASACKLALGYWLRHVSCAYANHYQRRYGKGGRPAALRSVTFVAGKMPASTGKC